MFDYQTWVESWLSEMRVQVSDSTLITLTIDEHPFLLKQMNDVYLMAVGIGPVPPSLNQGQALLLLNLNAFNARTQPLQVGIVNGGDLVAWLREPWATADLSSRYSLMMQTAADLRKELSM
ncbi:MULTISPECIES: hypothetical protein [Burkholderia]|uniref:Uncharacterized protein n=1 Tax=Burkholderia humptydooensis TaxID=430531 RepID=A0A7U4SVG9_9BURK|nr:MULTISPECIES: hypothetical protein [Burkholderia]AGK51235.1 hypothetical protein BTI_4267 [Burkholderia thailandensis MSMB121]ATF33995.1 hypothetical protein CO709_01225 [Burkholderia thailandensis]AJY39991.1 hypothetical protein BW21_3807 [Burkholderia sp. 2002721687]ALX46926.1 hypothetical protein AQ610_21860 [Burkholderia humptydooensis]KST72670.1 hypothetical protein WS76_27595 [Burkholderia humptydooensis]